MKTKSNYRIPMIGLFLALAIVQGAGQVSTITNLSEGALRAAVAQGGTVTIAADGTITLGSTIPITLDTVLDATGHQVTLSGGNAVPVLHVNSGVRLTVLNLTIADGLALWGAGIFNETGTVDLISVTLRSNVVTNEAWQPPGLVSKGGQGAGIYSQGILNATNCLFSGNTGRQRSDPDPGTYPDQAYGMYAATPCEGGAIYSSGVLNLSNCRFEANEVHAAPGYQLVYSGSVQGVHAGRQAAGGAIFSAGPLSVSQCTFASNAAYSGWTPGWGYSPTISSIQGVDGTAAYGGAICAGPATIQTSSFLNNQVVGGNGGQGGSATSGAAPGGRGGGASGGALCIAAAGNVTDSTFAGNTATGGWGGIGGDGSYIWQIWLGTSGANGGTGGAGAGGALFSAGALSLVNCTLANNLVVGGQGGTGGGGVAGARGSGSGGQGGDGGPAFGVIDSTNGLVSLTNSTLASNVAAGGAGGSGGPNSYSYGPPAPPGAIGLAYGGLASGATLVNCLLASNTPANCHGWIADAGHNLSSDSLCGLTNSSSLNGIDPRLGPLAANGGPTVTMALLEGSPAIDAADTASAPSTDQRGFPRPYGPAADIGAYEAMPVYAVTLAASPPDGGSAVGGGTFGSGASVIVLAAPNSGFGFVNWTENGAPVSASTNYTFTLTTNRALIANFAPAYTVTVNASPAAAGSVQGSGAFTNGAQVTVTTTPNPGYAFLNWTENGAPVSSDTGYTFTVTANRLLIANFTAIYTVIVDASPSEGGSVQGGDVFVSGANVTLAATPSPDFHFVNWTEQALVVSASNQLSFVVTSNCTFVANFATNVMDTISLSVSSAGAGHVNGAGAFRHATRRTVTASPASGFIFANWTENGVVVSSTATYTFTLHRDRNLVATFIPNPFPAVRGTFHGLFADEINGVSPQSAGTFTITVAGRGAFSGVLQLGSRRYSLTGQFDSTGTAGATLPLGVGHTLALALQVDLTNGTDRLTGTLSDGTWVATLAADRAASNGLLHPAPEAGSYTVLIPGVYGATNQPAGDSYGTLTVGKTGLVTLRLRLADGTLLTPSAPVLNGGQWPLCASFAGAQGILWGWLTFTNATDLGGAVAWVKRSVRSGPYQGGFSLTAEASGLRYYPPGKGTNVLGLTVTTNLVLALTGDGLNEGLTNRIALAANGQVTTLSGPTLSLTFAPATGAFSGKVGNAPKQVSFSGVVLQRWGIGAGFFMGTNASGEVLLEP